MRKANTIEQCAFVADFASPGGLMLMMRTVSAKQSVYYSLGFDDFDFAQRFIRLDNVGRPRAHHGAGQRRVEADHPV